METLRRLGVATAQAACDAARANGADPADVFAVIDYFAKRPGAWDLGFLAYRVGLCAKDLKPSDGWCKQKSTAQRPEKVRGDADRAYDVRAIVKDGHRRGATDEQIQAVIDRNGLSDVAAQMPWRRTEGAPAR